MNTKNHSIFKALEQYPNISIEDCEPEFLGINVINTVKTTLIKELGTVIYTVLILPFGIIVKNGFEQKSFKEEAEAYVYIEKKCSVVDLTQAPTYLDKLRTDEVLKSLRNKLKEIKK
jgi:hypothetical protein